MFNWSPQKNLCKEVWFLIFFGTRISPGSGAAPHTCNASTFGDQGRWIAWTQEFETSLGNMVKPRLYQKNVKISWGWWHVPVVPATWEAEAGGWLASGRWRLQWDKITSLHSNVNDRVSPYLYKTKQKGRLRVILMELPSHKGNLRGREKYSPLILWLR